MADENEQEERHPYDAIEERADEMGLEGDERDDYIEGRMRRAGFKKGPGAWVSISDDDDDDDSDHDDDDTPMTRGDWRRMQRENKQRQRQSYTPPRKKRSAEGGNSGGEGNGGASKPKRPNAWW
jgi:hypothetical protein